MRVIVNNSIYGMNRKQLRGLLKIASKQVPFGIYAVEKDDICELKNDKFDNIDVLKKSIKEYKSRGFKVMYNSNKNDR